MTCVFILILTLSSVCFDVIFSTTVVGRYLISSFTKKTLKTSRWIVSSSERIVSEKKNHFVSLVKRIHVGEYFSTDISTVPLFRIEIFVGFGRTSKTFFFFLSRLCQIETLVDAFSKTFSRTNVRPRNKRLPLGTRNKCTIVVIRTLICASTVNHPANNV